MFRRVNLSYRIIDAFFRHARLFIIAVLLVTGSVAGVLLTRGEKFVANASTQIVTENELTTAALGVQRQTWTSPAQEKVSGFYDLMKDDLPGGFVDSCLKKAKLAQPINISPEAKDPRYDAFKKNLTANSDGANVFTLTLIWPNPDECVRLLTAVRDQFTEETGLAKQASSIAVSNFLDSQIAVYRQRMQNAEAVLIAYKQTHSGQLPDAQKAEIGQLAQLRTERDYLKITASDNQLKRAALEQRLAAITPTSILEQTVSESPTAQQINELSVKRNALIADNYLPTSDMVKQVEEQIARLKPILQRERDNAARRQLSADSAGTNITETKLQNNPEYENLTQQLTEATIAQKTQAARLALLNTQIATYEARIQALPVAERALTERTRDYDIYKKQYEDLRVRREEARIKGDLDKVAATSTLQPLGVIYAESTTGLKKKLIMLVASVFLGLLVATGLVVLSEIFDPTLRYDTDAERMLGIPVLASLPESKAILGLPSGATPPRRRLFGRASSPSAPALPASAAAATAATAASAATAATPGTAYSNSASGPGVGEPAEAKA